MKQLVLGILAHVDAGKTTLSEALLYRTGAIRDLGRVDHKNAHLDTHALERARGITIFSRQARLTLGDTAVTLLDTPGHVDFSAEMERTLQVLDYAVLVISGTDGVQAHTQTLWQLLRRYRVPVFVFVTKMDLPGAERAALMDDLRAHLSGACVDFTDPDPEQIALCDEAALEQYLDTGALPDETVRALIRSRKLFPCLFGSGLKLTGVDAFLVALARYAAPPEYPEEFGARVFKIMRDAQGNRLTCLKVTGGQLRVRAPLTYFPRGADTPVQEHPLALLLAHDLAAAALADAVDDLFVGEHALAARAPVDGHRGLIGQAVLIHLQEDPLRPLIVGRVGRVDRAIPVKAVAEHLELLGKVGDVVFCHNGRVDMILDGVVLSRQTERIKADREQNVVALHPALAADDVHRRERARVADVQPLSGGIRELDQPVKLRARITGDGRERLFRLPARLPFFLDCLKIILHSVHFSLKKSKTSKRGGVMTAPNGYCGLRRACR